MAPLQAADPLPAEPFASPAFHLIRMTLTEQLDWVFSPVGPLASEDGGRFRPRDVQRRMALAIAQAMSDDRDLIVEAGTGVGKTFAYLIPLLLSGRRALISTATKTLQDQLFLRDIPWLTQRLQRPVQVALLKGRANYLCRHRLATARQRLETPQVWVLQQLARVERWAMATQTGDLSELEGLEESSSLRPHITSTRDNCLGGECPQAADCALLKARRKALQADLVVINHHLLFADVMLKDSGVAELLPSVDEVVVDEAHQILDTGLQFLGTALSTHQLTDLATDLRLIGPSCAAGLAPWLELAARLTLAAQSLRLAFRADSVGQATVRQAWEEGRPWPTGVSALTELSGLLAEVRRALQQVQESHPDLARLSQRAEELAERLDAFLGRGIDDGNAVRWVERSSAASRWVRSPLDVRDFMRSTLAESAARWTFTSATLGDDEGLSWFTQASGLEEAQVLRLESPFDYGRQARLWLPMDMPPPHDPRHPTRVGEVAALCAQRLGGRTLVLTTTLRALGLIAHALRASLAQQGAKLQVLVQGEASRRSLMQHYGQGVGQVLVGSQGFWEGVDLPGDALQCVVIDKLPFPPPNDPLIQARSRQVQRSGADPFDRLFLSEAAVSLKQGAGRLIRSESDEGLLVLADPRLSSMPYGRRLLRGLPPMGLCRDQAEALAWLAHLAASGAPTSTDHPLEAGG